MIRQLGAGTFAKERHRRLGVSSPQSQTAGFPQSGRTARRKRAGLGDATRLRRCSSRGFTLLPRGAIVFPDGGEFHAKLSLRLQPALVLPHPTDVNVHRQ